MWACPCGPNAVRLGCRMVYKALFLVKSAAMRKTFRLISAVALALACGCAQAQRQPPGQRLPGHAFPNQACPNQVLRNQAAPQAVPGFWDPRRRPDRPDLSRLTVIRFLTETDYPPFNYTGPDGNPAGFNVDLAQMICEEIKVTCTIQMRRFETLLDAISSNRGDGIIASLAVTPPLAR